MTARALLLALCLLAGQAFAASGADPEGTRPAFAPPEPVPVLAPIPSTGLSEDILDRMRERLTDQAPRSRREGDE